METDVSFEFLACLKDYRRKYVMLKAFRAWRKYLTANRRRYKKACLALEFWGYNTMKKCFSNLKKPKRNVDSSTGIPYSKGLYLIILAASTFISKKTFITHGCRLDKLLSLFKQNSILSPNIAVLRKFVKSWEDFLLQKYFGQLKKRWAVLRSFKNKRINKLKRKCFNCLQKVIRNKKGFCKLKIAVKKHYMRILKNNVDKEKSETVNNILASKHRRKSYMRKSFDILVEYYKWSKENNNKSSLTNKFYYLNLMMKAFTGFKMVSKSGRIQKNHKVMHKKFRTYRLLDKTFKFWKKFAKKRSQVKRSFKEYTNQKHLTQKKMIFSEWRWNYDSKVKIEAYSRLKLIEKVFKAFRERIDKTQKAFFISQRASERPRAERYNSEPQDWRELLDEKKEVLDGIVEFQNSVANRHLTKSFGKWKKYAHSKISIRKLKVQSHFYKELSYFKRYFSIWHKRYLKRVTNNKACELGNCFKETRNLKKCFDALREYYLKKMVKHTKGFKADEKYERSLRKKAFHALYLEREVAIVLGDKYFELYLRSLMEKSFRLLVIYSKTKRHLRNGFETFSKAKQENLIQKTFYSLKKRAESNLIKRKSNKLAEVIHKHKVYTKVLNALKRVQKLHKKALVLSNKKTTRLIKNYYSIWRSNFKEEKRAQKAFKCWKEMRQKLIFKTWKKYYIKKKGYKTIINKCTKKKDIVYMKGALLLWKKFISFNSQRHSVDQALFINYVHKFKKQVLQEWRNTTVKFQLLRHLAAEMINKREESVVPRYFKLWMKTSEERRNHTRNGLHHVNKKNTHRLTTLLKAWATVSKERIIKKKLLSLWNEKSNHTLIEKSLRAWKIYLANKYTKDEIIRIKSQVLKLKLLKRSFMILQAWAADIQRKRIICDEIRKTEEQRLLSCYFSQWCENFKDSAFDRASSAIVDQYRKIACFKLFQKRTQERKDQRLYSHKLDQFAFEIYKRRSFLEFLQNLVRRKTIRENLRQSHEVFKASQRKKAFTEFKTILQPRVHHTKANLKAMKYYVLTLYSMTFERWKLVLRRKARLEAVYEKIRDNIVYRVQKRVFNAIRQNRQANIQQDNKLEDSSKDFIKQRKRVLLQAWRNVAARKAQLKVRYRVWLQSQTNAVLGNYFQKWQGKYCVNVKRKYLLAGVVVRAYKRAVGQGFACLAISYFKQKKLELGFDEIHEKYITKLLKTYYETWKSQFVFQRLSNESMDGYW